MQPCVFTTTGAAFKVPEDVNKPDVTVGVLLGSTGETIAKKFLPNAKIKTYKGGGRMIVQALLAGHVDAGVNDDLAVLTVAAGFPPQFRKGSGPTPWPGQGFRWPLPCATIRSTCGSGSTCTSSLPTATASYDKNVKYWMESTDWKKDH